jgi:hypothetical protein
VNRATRWISVCEYLNIAQLKQEIIELGRSPVAEKMYPVTSSWVPLTDVLAVVERFERHWRISKDKKSAEEARLIAEILGGN